MEQFYGAMEKISVIIITCNAAETIGKCLSSLVGLSDDIVVVDSFSSDNTPDIVRRFTDRFFQEKWHGYAAQKRLALQKTTHRWVLWVDADEEVSKQLCSEIRTLDFSCDGYYINRKTWYLGRWIKHGGWYPNYVLRLFRKDRGQFSDAIVHERFEIGGKAGYLKGELYHYTYRDIRHHLEKMNEYTSLSVETMAAKGRKTAWPNLLFRPIGRFVTTYIFKQGFLDGKAGLMVSMLDAFYVFLKYAKLWEINQAHLPGSDPLKYADMPQAVGTCCPGQKRAGTDCGIRHENG